MIRQMKLYGKFLLMHLKCQMQDKGSFFLSALGQFLVSFTTLAGILFLFARFQQVEGFTQSEVLLCYGIVLLAFSMAECFGAGFYAFPRMLGDGRFDRILVQPRHEVFLVITAEMNLASVGRLAQAGIVFGYAVGTAEIYWGIDKILTVCLMVICGSLIFVGIYLLCAACSFFTTEGLEFINIFLYGGRDFGRYPFSVYGKKVLFFLTFMIPLALFQYYPLLYLCGRTNCPVFMYLPCAGLLFLAPCDALWRYGVRRYRGTGS